MSEKKRKLLNLILYGLAALIWIAYCVSTLRHGQMYFLQFLAAVVWTAGFFILLHRYRNERPNEEDRGD